MDHSEIATIRQQYQAGMWPQFLQMVQIDGLRGWAGQTVEFNFPVMAVVGENGSGKSTLLKVAACAYSNKDKDRRFYPSSLFIGTHWDKIEEIRIDYRIKRGHSVESFKITKPTQRWRVPEKQAQRDVFIFDISRTLPLDASAGYAKIARSAAAEVESSEITEEFRQRLSHVLGRAYTKARFATSDVDQKRKIGLLGREWGELSQFHQGAGEDATLDLFLALQGLPEYSLLLIDEVEASLHPRAQRRLTRFLLWLSRHRRIQVILSTHSPYVLQELPQEARVLLLPGPLGLSVVYGVSAEFAMTRLDDDVHPEVHLFVEDRDALILVREMLASQATTAALLQRVAISPVGPANVVTTLGQLAAARKLPYPSLAILDGDHQSTGCLSLPGAEAPERMVYSALKAKNWPNLDARFGIGAGTLHTALEDAMLEPDHHRWNAMVGDRILKSSTSVWEVLSTEWCRSCLNPGDLQRLVDSIQNVMAQSG